MNKKVKHCPLLLFAAGGCAQPCGGGGSLDTFAYFFDEATRLLNKEWFLKYNCGDA
jgi:hypothetical protein